MPKALPKVMLMVNPLSGGGRALDLLPAADKLISGSGIKPDVRIPENPGEMTRTAELASNCGYDRIIVMGGDGTVNRVAMGLMGSETVLGLIPCGNGNDFARMLRIPKDLKSIVDIAIRATPIATDVGMVDNQPFFNMIGIGFDAMVAEKAKNEKHAHGLASYLISVYKTLKEYPPNNIRLRIDSFEVEKTALLVAVGIGQTSGSGFRLTPQAVIDDGKFDVCLVDYARPLRILSLLPRALRGIHIREPEVSIYRCRQLEIYSDRPLPVHYEGETMLSENGKISVKMTRDKLLVASGVKTG